VRSWRKPILDAAFSPAWMSDGGISCSRTFRTDKEVVLEILFNRALSLRSIVPCAVNRERLFGMLFSECNTQMQSDLNGRTTKGRIHNVLNLAAYCILP
jgi:hypothetical protein